MLTPKENDRGSDKMASGKHLIAIIIVMVLVTAGALGALVLMEPSNADTSISATFASPSDGSTVTGMINVTANITSKSAVSYALLRMDGIELGNKSASPFYWHLNTTHYEEGQHILNITAFNAASKHVGAQITLVINNGNTTVAITSPTNQSKVSGMMAVVPQVISPRVISYVSCAIDGTEVGNTTSAPYAFDLNTTTHLNGNHDVSVMVTDEVGQRSHAEVTLFFDNPFDIAWGDGNSTHFNSTPQKIVSLGSSFTEIIFAIGADQRLIGVDTSSNYPAATLSKNIVGSSSNPTREVVASLHPDCIIIWNYNMNANLIAELKQSYTVVCFYPKTIADCEKVILKIGNLTGRNAQATSLVSNMEARLNAVAARIASIPFDQRPLVYYEQSNGKSVGNGSLGNEIITRAGGKNIYWNSSVTNPTYNSEYIRHANPDFIIIDNASATSNVDIAARSGWDTINAIQDFEPDHIYRINARMMSITPRIVDAIEQMMGWFYPT